LHGGHCAFSGRGIAPVLVRDAIQGFSHEGRYGGVTISRDALDPLQQRLGQAERDVLIVRHEKKCSTKKRGTYMMAGEDRIRPRGLRDPTELKVYKLPNL